MFWKALGADISEGDMSERKPNQKERLITLQVPLQSKPRKKGKPRGNPAAIKPYQFQPGQSGNPSGRPKGTNVLSTAYTIRLGNVVPNEVAAALGVDKCTWAEAIAIGMIRHAAMGDTAAAKEIREVTEGRVPAALNLEGKIDYSAGQTAKQQLMKMLGEPER